MAFPNLNSFKNHYRALLFILCSLLIVLSIFFVKNVYFDSQNNSTQKPFAELPPLAGTTSASVSSNHIVIVAFGDSVTAGYGISVAEAYPKKLEEILLANGYPVTILNAGVSGETTAGGLRRASFVAAQKPDIVILALGGNDVLRGVTPSNTRENLAQMISIFQNAGIHVLLVGMLAPSNLGEQYVSEFNAMYPRLAKEYSVPLVPFLLDGVALNPTLNQQDGIHPNETGAKIIAEENIYPILAPLILEVRAGK